ncbi:GroES-like protein [Meredithblackwellia eburnea MCA 4105]
MKAVVVKGPNQIVIEDRPKPTLQAPTDVIIKASAAGLCGSDLNILSGKRPNTPWDFIIGHEVVGTVEEVGSEVTKIKKGDRVVSAFTQSCQECWYCLRSLSGKCLKGKPYGVGATAGVQSEWARIPLANGSLFKAPEDLPDEEIILMCDVLPTGYTAFKNAWLSLPDSAKNFKDLTCVVVGCGPVGLMGLLSAMEVFKTVYAVDGVQDRLDRAASYGAIPLHLSENPAETVLGATGGRGADAVLEIVGSPAALQLSLDCVRPGGAIGSCGFHYQEITIQGTQIWAKNATFKFGRTSVAEVYDECLVLLKKWSKEGKLKGFVERTSPIEDAAQCYDLFSQCGS